MNRPSTRRQQATPSNPCVRQCCLDEKDVCIGCHRTLDQIRRWHQMSEKERLAIMKNLPPPSPGLFLY